MKLAAATVFTAVANFFKTGPDGVPLTDAAEIRHKYRTHRISVFLSITLGYAMYYVIRQGFAVVKKPLMEAGVFDAMQIGTIGSVFFVTYMVGKCLNGFLADRLNIKRFLALSPIPNPQSPIPHPRWTRDRETLVRAAGVGPVRHGPVKYLPRFPDSP